MGKKILRLGLILIIIFLLSAIFLLLTSENPSRFSEEEHIKRVSERVEQKLNEDYFDSIIDEPLTGFAVYPLYTEDDELKYMLVEFEPIGFMYVIITRRIPILSCSSSQSMYGLGYAEKSGESKSPYSIIGAEAEKKYFFRAEGLRGYIPAIKKEDRYLNLISNEEFEYQKKFLMNDEKPATTFVNFIPSHQFDL